MTAAPQNGSHYKIIVFGNNVCGNLDPSASLIIDKPTDLTFKIQCNDILWCSWNTTIGKDPICIWGNNPLTKDGLFENVDVRHDLKRVIGVDHPLAILLQNGDVKDTKGDLSLSRWDDVVTTDMHVTYACKDGKLYRYESLEDLMQSSELVKPIGGLPIFQGSEERSNLLKLYATESRAFVLVTGAAQHIYELVDVRTLPPGSISTSESVQLRYIDELEALGEISVVAGSGNRVGVITEVGEGYIIPAKGDMERLDLEDEEIRLMGVGSNFEIVVTNENIYVRGSSEYLHA